MTHALSPKLQAMTYDRPSMTLWSPEARGAAAAPILSYWQGLAAAQQAQHSAITIVPRRLWCPEAKVLSFSVPGAHRSLSRQFSKAELDHIRLIWALDIVFAPRFGEPGGPFGLQPHFHLLADVGPDNRRMHKRIRDSLEDWAPGNRALHFQAVKAARGGLEGWLGYSIKDWSNPLKAAPGGPQPCNNRWTGLMRTYVAKMDLRLADLIGLKNLRRVHGRIVPVSRHDDWGPDEPHE